MAQATKQFSPDYAVPPGWILEERLDVNSISHAEFARRCGRSPKLISEIISGKASLEPETALQFEKVLGVPATIWLGLESRYQLKQARDAEALAAAEMGEWANAFPVKELVKRGFFSKPVSDSDTVTKLLSFFGVASVDAWHVKYSATSVAYRHSPAFNSNIYALSTWFRLGELTAEKQECNEYSSTGFKAVLRKIRALTQKPVVEALTEAQQLCNQAGVAVTLIKPLPKTALSGAAWWQTPNSAVIQLSMRHKTNDHLWFSFFHEAAHILLHGKRHNKLKSVFIDGKDCKSDPFEEEANKWASDFLIPESEWLSFLETRSINATHVQRFANEQGIAPGIIVGRLQNAGLVPWASNLNGLKVKLRWAT